MYLSSADLLSIQFRMVSMQLHEGPQKTTEQSKLGGEHLREDGRLLRTIRYYFYSGILTQVYSNYVPAWRVVLHIDIILCQCVNNYP